MKRSNRQKRLKDWEEKVLHGQHLRQSKEVRSDQSWAWLQNGELKRETESLIVAAQNQSIRDFSTQTDHVIEAPRPDLVVVGKKERSCKIIDFAVPGDGRIKEQEKDKIKISRLRKGVTKEMEC